MQIFVGNFLLMALCAIHEETRIIIIIIRIDEECSHDACGYMLSYALFSYVAPLYVNNFDYLAFNREGVSLYIIIQLSYTN